MKVLYIGDIVGKIGRKAVAKIVPKLKKKHNIDIVVANAENSAHGSGITEDIIKELQTTGIDAMTAGDHAFRRVKQSHIYDKYPIIGPANIAKKHPGADWLIIPVKKEKILVINLIGRVFMKTDHDCPFYKLDEILANTILAEKNISAIILEVHAETTSEKTALSHYADGRVAAVLGTHTHIMTADARITNKGTALITDIGMVGADNECLGVAKEGIIKTFLTQIKNQHIIPEKGPAIFNAVLLTIRNGKTTSIKPIIEHININK